MSRYEDLSDDGEVDHTFFDSDDDVAKKVENNVADTVMQKEVLQGKGKKQENGINVTASLEAQEGSSSDDERERNERPEKRAQYDRHSMVSSTASLGGQRSESSLSSGRNSTQSLKMRTTIPTGIPKITREYEDNYYTDEETSSDEGKKPRYRPKSAKQPGSVRKNISKKISSSSSSSDAESSKSDGCRSASSSHLSAKTKKSAVSSLSSPERRSKSAVKSSEGNRKLQDYQEESEDTVTDVTPLSTPDISPIQSFDLAATNEMKKKMMKKQENVSQEIYDPEMEQKLNQNALHDAMELNQLLKAFMHLDKKEERNLVIDHPATSMAKNYSFTNEEVRQIDRENQRLLKELSRQKPRSKSTTPKKSSGPPTRLYHSTLNRQREQLRIERENMALLKRLESIKPTVGMTRSEQLTDYQRQAGYLSSSASSPRPVKSSTSRHSLSLGVSRASSAGTHRSDRSISSTSSAALLRPTKSTNVRAAWL